MPHPRRRIVFVLKIFSLSVFFFGFPIRFPSDFLVLVEEVDVFPIDLKGSRYLLFLSQ